MIAATLLATALVQTPLSAPTGPAFTSPSTKWVVEYHESMCVVSRAYGSGPDAVTLVLRPTPLSSRSEVVLLTSRKPDRAGKAKLLLLPDGADIKVDFERVATADRKSSFARLFFESENLKGLSGATGVALTIDGETHRLAIPAAAAAMRALTTCQADLLRTWGIDPAELTAGGTQPTGNVGQFFGRDQYPVDAIRARVQGRVVAVLTVETDGRVSECRIVERVYPSLDAITCAIATKKIRYAPARDPKGDPRRVHVVLPVRWSITE